MAKNNERQNRFIEEYLIDLNGTQAAIRAGYSPNGAGVRADGLLKNSNVRARIDKALAERSRRTGITQDRVLRELARMAFVNAPDVINMLDATMRDGAGEDDTAAIYSVKVKIRPTPDGNEIEREIKLHDKLKANELLMKHLGMLTDRVQADINLVPKIIDDVPNVPKDDPDDTPE